MFIPKHLIIDGALVLNEFDEYTNKFGIVVPHRDRQNTLMNIFEDIHESPENNWTKTNTTLLIIAPELTQVRDHPRFTEWCYMTNRIKSMLMDTIIKLRMESVIKHDGGRFSFFLKEIKGNSLILTHLNG